MTATPSTARTPQRRTRQTEARIISYLANHGASTVSNITQGVPASRDTIRARLAEMEESGTIRADIPAGQRGGTTPYYSLTKTGMPSETLKSVISVFIRQAADGQLTLAFDNYPGLSATAGRFIDIPEVARHAAAHHTDQPQDKSTVHIRF
ncbi:hypothetical protein [Arthrobacter humicola]